MPLFYIWVEQSSTQLEKLTNSAEVLYIPFVENYYILKFGFYPEINVNEFFSAVTIDFLLFFVKLPRNELSWIMLRCRKVWFAHTDLFWAHFYILDCVYTDTLINVFCLCGCYQFANAPVTYRSKNQMILIVVILIFYMWIHFLCIFQLALSSNFLCQITIMGTQAKYIIVKWWKEK